VSDDNKEVWYLPRRIEMGNDFDKILGLTRS